MKRLRLRKIIDKIEKDPSCWDQYEYHCGTAHCVFGHAQIAMGRWKNGYHTTYAFSDGMKYLGLSRTQAIYLSNPLRTLKQIKAFEKTNGEIPKEDEL